MDLIPPAGYHFYGGADALDSFPDADGYLWYGDNFSKDGDDDFFEFFVCRMKNNIVERIPLPQPINGAGRLNWTPAGLYVAGTYRATEKSPIVAKVFQVTQFKQFTNNYPIVHTVVGTAVTSVDQYARDLAQTAKNDAKDAMSRANTALAVANSKPSIDVVWQKINDRLSGLIEALATGNRTDGLDARFQDVLFSKVNDWIYGFLKSHGLIK